ncbi:hypothetical protein BDZ89DRAFT_1134816 [Hymenopellis radicata]|nr:hypothetical protein BDZ89DRAFT_1134816 [Hymenopellis radicata]
MAPWLRALLHRDPNHNAALRICAAWRPKYTVRREQSGEENDIRSRNRLLDGRAANQSAIELTTPESVITFAPSTRRRLNADVLLVLRTTALLGSHQAPITISPSTRTSSNIAALPTAPINDAEKLLVVARDIVNRLAPRLAIDVSRSGCPSSNTAPNSLVNNAAEKLLLVATDPHQDDIQLQDENNKGQAKPFVPASSHS